MTNTAHSTHDKSFKEKQESKTRDGQRPIARTANLGCRGEKKQEGRDQRTLAMTT